MALMFPTVMIMLNLSSIAAVWFGGNRIGAGEMQIGALIAFPATPHPDPDVGDDGDLRGHDGAAGSVCAERIAEVLDTESSVAQPGPGDRVALSATPSSCAASALVPGRRAPVLCDIDLRAEPGTTTAIIGSTGAGKTTLLPSSPPVRRHRRLGDDRRGRRPHLDLDLLWSRIGLVPQKPYLFTGTVASNLRQADPDATTTSSGPRSRSPRPGTSSRPWTAVSRPASARAARTSGGQRQRLAIARAIVRKPGIYLFDDSFSALDLATDARLRAALAPTRRTPPS